MSVSRKEVLLSQAEAHRLLAYDPDSGLFVRRISRGNQFSKAGTIAGYIANKGYIRIEINGEWYAAHRLAWFMTFGRWPSKFLDHVNGIKTDNRIGNLREADRSVNAQNQRLPSKNNKTGFLGVSKREGAGYASRPFTAQIHVPGTVGMKHLGYFASAEEAHQAYLEAKREIHAGCTI